MAKLKAGGQKELYRLVKENAVTDEDKDRISESRTFITIMDSGKVLRKLQIRYKSDQYHPKGELHDWGWKLIVKMDSEKAKQYYLSKGFKLI